MSEEQQVINRFIDEFQTGGNTAAADELLASDFVDHTPFPGFGSTREDVKRLFAIIRVGLPDLRAEVVRPDRVCRPMSQSTLQRWPDRCNR